jgi:DNA invertase Pin-like site-specific DNA recombinase
LTPLTVGLLCCSLRSKRVVGNADGETIDRIRREHFIKGKTIKEIARDLKISRNTVCRVLRSGVTSFACDRDIQPRPKLLAAAVPKAADDQGVFANVS